MQIGDIVYLKSGSPAMTLVAPDGKNWVCQWSRGSDLTTANIPELALVVDDPRPAMDAASVAARDVAMKAAATA